MIFKEPKVEFVEIEPENTIATSGGAAIDVCAPGSSNDPNICFPPRY